MHQTDLWLSYLIFIIVVFTHLTDGEVLILHKGKHDEPLYINNHKSYQSKWNHHQTRSRGDKRAVLHYGRHTYSLDDKRSMSKRGAKHNHFNIQDLVRTKPNKNDRGDYVKDLLILSEPPIHFKCDKNGKCDQDSRKFSKISKKADLEWKNKRMPVGYSKRFKIVNNKSKKKAKKDKLDRNSEKEDNNKKRPPPIFNKKKYDAVTASSASKESKSSSIEPQAESQEDSKSGEQSGSKERGQSGSGEESGSGEASESQSNSGSGEQSGSGEGKENSSSNSENWEVEKELYESKSKSVEESKDNKRNTSKGKHTSNEKSSSESKSENSVEDKPSKEVSKEKKKRMNRSKKKKKKASESREIGNDQNRKHLTTNDVVLQGHKIYSRNDKYEKKRNSTQRSKRRRLQQFMPKRYHWEESEIHDLGYFWYNGPRGLYPAPKALSVA